MEKIKIFPLKRGFLKILVIVLSTLVLLLTCFTIYLLGRPNLEEDTTKTNRAGFPIKTFCDRDYATVFCKIIYDYEPKKEITERNKEIEEEDLFFNNLEIIINDFAQGSSILDCDKTEAYKNKGCNFIAGADSYISFVRSETREGKMYSIYSIGSESYPYTGAPTEIKYYELSESTKQVTDVTKRELERIAKKFEEDEIYSKKAIEAIKKYLNITEVGKYEAAGQNPSTYMFKDGSLIEVGGTIDNTLVVGTYINLSQDQKFFKIELSSSKVTEITLTEWEEYLKMAE